MPAPQVLALSCRSAATFSIIHPFSCPGCHYSDLRPESIRHCCICMLVSICSQLQRLALDEHHHLEGSVLQNEPYQHLTEDTCHLLINPLLRARQLNVHVAIDAHETALVLCLTPFETNNDLLVDSMIVLRKQDSALRSITVVKKVCGGRGGTYRFCSMGRGLMGMN